MDHARPSATAEIGLSDRLAKLFAAPGDGKMSYAALVAEAVRHSPLPIITLGNGRAATTELPYITDVNKVLVS
jgi:hypothetical protein